MVKVKEKGKNEVEGRKWRTRIQREEKNSKEGKSQRREQRHRVRK
jgi:hypothetical protein